MSKILLGLAAVALLAVVIATAVQSPSAAAAQTAPAGAAGQRLIAADGPSEVLSLGKNATASSRRHGRHAQSANDSRMRTRWAAGSTRYPQWWRVDLGEVCEISEIKIAWFHPRSRAYRFVVSAGARDGHGTVVLDNRHKPARRATVRSLKIEARYVTVKITGSARGRAAIREVRVLGKPRPKTPGPAPTPTVSPSPTSSPAVSATPTPTPSPTLPTTTPTPSAPATPSPTPTTGTSIRVSGTTGQAIDAAFSTARAGDTVVFPEGVYSRSSRLVIPDGVNVRGSGIYRPSDGSGTWLQFAIKWGSDSTIEDLRIGDATSSFSPVSRETSDALEQRLCPDTFMNGSHDVAFKSVRFRGSGNLINLGGYSGDWTSRVNKTDCYRTAWYDCEFERGCWTNAELNSSARAGQGNMFNIWVDCRRGGSRIFDLSWVRCHFGVKNGATTWSAGGQLPDSAAQPDGYGSNRMAILMQPAPAEHAPNGPRQHLSTFDWTQLDHTFPGPYLVKDCVFEYSWEYTINPCDQSRAYSMSQCARLGHCDDQGSNWTHPGGSSSNCPDGWGNGTGWQWTILPDRFWLSGMSIVGNTFKGNVPGGSLSPSVIVGEQMRDSLSADNSSALGALSSPRDGRFGNANRDNVTGTGDTAYTPSPYDP